MNNPLDYTNYSGGADGADMMWDRIGRAFGVAHHIHWRPIDVSSEALTFEGRTEMLLAVKYAAKALGRPEYFKGIELVQRNWLQVYHAEAIYAISRIIEAGALDKGFTNKSGKQVVSGGTGWAVEMAIQMNKPVFVFDMTTFRWYFWSSSYFIPSVVPILTHKFAGIGSRKLTPEGIQAIRDVYINTFKA